MIRPQVPEGIRRCSKCGEEKTADQFYDSVPTRCIKCVREYQRQWYFKNYTSKRPKLPEGMRRCSTCHEIKPVNRFYRDRSNVSGYNHRCKICSDKLRNARRLKEQEARVALKEVLPEGYKRCSKCARVLPLLEFDKYRKDSEKRRQPCKECVKEYRKQPHVKKRVKFYKQQPAVRDRQNKLRLAQRRTDERLRAQEKAYRQEYQKRDYVIEKARQQNAEYRAHPENKEKACEVSRLWRQDNPEQRREQNRIKYLRNKGLDGGHTIEQWEELLALCDGCVYCGTMKDIARDHIIATTKGGSDRIDNIQPMCRKHNSEKHTQCIDYRPRYVRKWAHEQVTRELEATKLAEARGE